VKNRLSSNFVISCFVFLLIFIAGGCAKKAMVAPEVEKAGVAPKVEESPDAGRTYEEETVFQRFRQLPEDQPAPDLFVSEPSADFKEMAAPASKSFERAPNLEVIHFEFDRYSIRLGDREKLSRNAAWMNSNPDAFVRIEGHCDARGTSDYNLALGDRRANATKNYLVSLGVNPSRVSIVTYGEERPLCSESMESCWSQNRRAEFLVAR
tara:strand:+ start:13256 stop:13882 length:627 start_codon:yes stop_codon:yes gene_type:complete